MLFTLTSALHREKAQLILPVDEAFIASHQVVAVLTGGTENQFLELVQSGKLTLAEPIFLLATQQSNSLAASMEILSWINLNHGHGEVRSCGLAQ